jgi:hypothetical protein
MDNNKRLPLYQKMYSLTKYNYKMVKNFPKEYKYSLGAEITNLSLVCLDIIVEANTLPNTNKAKKIHELSLALDKLKLRIRIAQEVGVISVKQFAHIQENYLINIGEMTSGWQKWAKGSGGAK